MTTRDIEAHLQEIYGASVGRDTISRVTDAVMSDAKDWQERPLQAVYPVLYLDAMVRHEALLDRAGCETSPVGCRSSRWKLRAV